MNDNLKCYYDYTISPLGRLFYQSLWEQLGDVYDKKILDFGSGFAFTANHFAQKNTVIAIEPDEDILAAAIDNNAYTQMIGSTDLLDKLESNSFDLILCHLVCEFVEDFPAILRRFPRLLKPGGLISIVRHNREGRVLQAAVLENDIEESCNLIDGANSFSPTFGDIVYLNDSDIVSSLPGFLLEKSYGIRTFASLQSLDIQSGENWVENMMNIERKVFEDAAYKRISFFNHLIFVEDEDR